MLTTLGDYPKIMIIPIMMLIAIMIAITIGAIVLIFLVALKVATIVFRFIGKKLNKSSFSLRADNYEGLFNLIISIIPKKNKCT